MKTDASRPGPAGRRASPLRILFLIIFIGALSVPLFNKVEPTVLGFPFFYWFQIVWVPVSSFLIFLVFRAEDKGAQ